MSEDKRFDPFDDLSLDITEALMNIRDQITDREVVQDYFEGVRNSLNYFLTASVEKRLPSDSILRQRILEFKDSVYILIRDFVDEINVSFGYTTGIAALMELAQVPEAEESLFEESASGDEEFLQRQDIVEEEEISTGSEYEASLVEAQLTTVTQVTQQVTEEVLTIDHIDMDLFGSAYEESSEETETVYLSQGDETPVEEEEISSGSEFHAALEEQFIFVPEAFLGKPQKTRGVFGPTTADVNNLIIALMNLDGKRLPKQLGRALKAVYGDDLENVVLKVRDISINNTLELSNLQHRRKLLEILQNEILRHQAYILSEDATAKPLFQEANDALRQYDEDVLRDTLLAWGMFQSQ